MVLQRWWLVLRLKISSAPVWVLFVRGGQALTLCCCCCFARRFNTKENLRKLLTSGEVVGETKRALQTLQARSNARDGYEEGEAETKTAPAASTTGPTRCGLDLSGLLVGWDDVKRATQAELDAMVEQQLAQIMAMTGGILPPGLSKNQVGSVARVCCTLVLTHLDLSMLGRAVLCAVGGENQIFSPPLSSRDVHSQCHARHANVGGCNRRD